MGRISDFVRMQFLKAKAKLRGIYNHWTVQSLVHTDITFAFLFLGLYLVGAPWNGQYLLASFGAWQVIKEVFKLIRLVAQDLKPIVNIRR